jgi:hypothetical protein
LPKLHLWLPPLQVALRLQRLLLRLQLRLQLRPWLAVNPIWRLGMV